MNIHEKYIKRCIEIAKNGLGTTYPNPLVGSIIVYDENIIGEGWHSAAGLPHAEVLAIRAVKDKKMLENAVLYVNLEPCSHYGRTPPCCDLILASGIKNVVIGTADPFKEVAGSGIRKLREAGCTVTAGVLEAACRELNKRFFTFHIKKRPYIILKWAESADGFLSSGRIPAERENASPEWISNGYSRQLVHKWRSEEQAVLAGTNTMLYDNPKLNVRDWEGNAPVRVILDRELRIPEDYAVWDGSVTTVFISDREHQIPDNEYVENEQIDFSGTVAHQLCELLYRRQLQSVIVEGGAQTLQTFINEDLWDEARVFTAGKTLGKGIKAPQLHTAVPALRENIAGDVLTVFGHPGNSGVSL